MSSHISPVASPRYWIWWTVALVWWTLDGFTDATNYYRMAQGAGDAISWEEALHTTMVSAWLWVPLTVFALALTQRFPLDDATWRRYLAVHVVAAFAVCVFRALAVVVMNPWVGWYRAVPEFPNLLFTSFANNFFLFWMLIGVGHTLVYARRFQERDRQLARAELSALKMQLHPHFIFNTLNAVVSLVYTEPEKADRMITRLSGLLRHAMARTGVHQVSLEEEIAVARSYLEIEEMRFGDRLRVSWHIDVRSYGARVPHLILQPLIENAVRHGIAPRGTGGTLYIATDLQAGMLSLRVRDDGVGCAPEGRRSSGVGLSNVRARMRQLYGERHTVEIFSAPGKGFEIVLRFPFRRSKEPLDIDLGQTADAVFQ